MCAVYNKTRVVGVRISERWEFGRSPSPGARGQTFDEYP